MDGNLFHKITCQQSILLINKEQTTFKVPVASPSKCLYPCTLTRTELPSLKLFSNLASLSAMSAAWNFTIKLELADQAHIQTASS